jgi:diguanylate cyclase (GGDEF)-like protein
VQYGVADLFFVVSCWTIFLLGACKMIADLINPAEPQILVVDDSKVVRWSISKILGDDYQVHEVEDAESALALLRGDTDISLVFCDIQMPGIGGHQFLQRLRADGSPRLLNLPVIMLSAENDTEELKKELLAEGATDFVRKPFDESTLQARVAAYVNYQQQIVRLERDTELDPISGLAGRNYFQLHVERNLTLATRHGIEFTLAVLEIDGYQKLLDEMGNRTFIQLLFQVGKSIKDVIRTEDLAARIDQARFGLVLPLTKRVGGRMAIERIIRDVDNMVLKYAGEPLKMSISAGMSVFEVGSVLSSCGLIAMAEEALQEAVASGGNTVAGCELSNAEHVSVGACDQSFELIREICAGVTDTVSDQELRQILSDIRPVLDLADNRFGLNLGEQLQSALDA